MRFLHPAGQGSRALLARASVLTTAAFLLGAMLTPTMASVTTNKTYSDAAAPGSISAGQTVTGATFSITNTNDQQTLGSANITPPSGVTIAPSPLSVSFASGASTSGVSAAVDSGGAIELRNLNLAYNDTVTLTFTLTAACGATGGSWGTQVKQSNSFNGPPGNDFTNSADDPSLAITGAGCYLAFVDQPANAAKTDYITNATFDPTGGPVTVGAYDGSGKPIDGVTVSIASDPTSNLTSATATTGLSTSGAPASFSTLKITTSGTYDLVATAAGFTSAISNSFIITDTASTCTSGTSCSVTDQGTGGYSNTTGTATSAGTSTGNYLAMTLSANGNLNECTGYTGFSKALIDVEINTGSVTISTIEIDKVLSGKVGVSSFQVCFSPKTTSSNFTDRSGNSVTVGQWGLLPDCTSNKNNIENAPCVVSRNRSQSSSNVLITIAIPAGDPPRYFS